MASTLIQPGQHRGRNVGGPHACGYCHMRFENEPLRRRHVNKNHEELLHHACQWCSRRFEGARALTTHCGQEHAERYVQRKKYHEAQREWNLRKLYGIGIAEYTEILDRQDGCCAGCGQPNADARGLRLHVDHDHVKGVVRGLLCGNCNMALGKLHDDPALLRKLAFYLERGGV